MYLPDFLCADTRRAGKRLLLEEKLAKIFDF